MLALILMHVSAYLVCFCHVCRIGLDEWRRRDAKGSCDTTTMARCRWWRQVAWPCDAASATKAGAWDSTMHVELA